MPWHRRAWAGLLLRLAGILLLGGAAASIRHLGAPPPPRDVATMPAAAWLAALASFVAASAGAALLAMGAHLFDPVELSGRWRRSG